MIERFTKGFFVGMLICVIIFHIVVSLAKAETLHWLPTNESWSISIPVEAKELYDPPDVYFRDSAGKVWKSIQWKQLCQD